MFRALRNPTAVGRLSDNGIYSNVVLDHGRPWKLTDLPLFGPPHVMRDTAATNALEHGADIAKGWEWLGHASIQASRVYNRRHTRAEDSPTFKVAYQADLPPVRRRVREFVVGSFRSFTSALAPRDRPFYPAQAVSIAGPTRTKIQIHTVTLSGHRPDVTMGSQSDGASRERRYPLEIRTH